MEPRVDPITSAATPRPIPRVGGGVPNLGQALAFQRDPLGLFLPAWREHGELFQFRLGGRDFVLFAGP
ncbi:MAG: cytochrome P450, partial [Gammaproteobacteria bacterium]